MRKKYVTLKELKEVGACSWQLEKFKKTFGKRAEINKENIGKAWAAGLDVDWLDVDWIVYRSSKNLNTVMPKVDDTITIRDDFFLYDPKRNGVGLNDEMIAFAGKTGKVTSLDTDYSFHTDIDDRKWEWHVNMIEIIN